jgi:hypothetical protein
VLSSGFEVERVPTAAPAEVFKRYIERFR